jgi:hypothetical protein
MAETAYFEDTRKKLERLSTAISDYEAFAKKFEAYPTAWVEKAFRGDDNENPKPIISSTDNVDITQEWDAFLKQNEYENIEIIRMIRRGLTMGKGVLLERPDFMDFIALQAPHPRVYKWLHASVWRFCILRDAPYNNGDVWFSCLESMGKALLERLPLPNNLTQIQDQLKELTRYKRWLKDDKHTAYMDQLLKKIVSVLKTKQSNEQNVLNDIKSWCFQHLALTLYADEYIVQRSLDVYFTECLNEYMKNRMPQNNEALRFLLNVFCDLFTQEGTRRFAIIFQGLEGRLSSQEKEAIIELMGDPRKDPEKWNLLKSREEGVYEQILYWFNKADFEWFFDFIFKDKFDEHRRKDCWKRYLRYANEFKVFLPSDKMQEFHVEKARMGRDWKISTEPIFNTSGLTSFVIKTPKVLIYETAESGNASYIYDLKALGFGTKQVQNFIEKAFSNTPVQKIDAKHHLAHTGLAPDIKAVTNPNYFRQNQTQRHWRVTHDQNPHSWQEPVRVMMEEIHDMKPLED